MHGEKKDNLLSEKILQETFDEIKLNQKSLIDSTSCKLPERKVRSYARVWCMKVPNRWRRRIEMSQWKIKCVGVNLFQLRDILRQGRKIEKGKKKFNMLMTHRIAFSFVSLLLSMETCDFCFQCAIISCFFLSLSHNSNYIDYSWIYCFILLFSFLFSLLLFDWI